MWLKLAGILNAVQLVCASVRRSSSHMWPISRFRFPAEAAGMKVWGHAFSAPFKSFPQAEKFESQDLGHEWWWDGTRDGQMDWSFIRINEDFALVHCVMFHGYFSFLHIVLSLPVLFCILTSPLVSDNLPFLPCHVSVSLPWLPQVFPPEFPASSCVYSLRLPLSRCQCVVRYSLHY